GVGLLRSHAYEVKTALGIKSEPPPPPPTFWQTPEYVRELPHQDEGLLFTMVAGLLNLLLIHDAFCGAPGASAAREEAEDAEADDEEALGGWRVRHLHPGLPRARVRRPRREGGPSGRARAVDAPAHGAPRVRDRGVRRGDPARVDGVLGLASGVTDAP